MQKFLPGRLEGLRNFRPGAQQFASLNGDHGERTRVDGDKRKKRKQKKHSIQPTLFAATWPKTASRSDARTLPAPKNAAGESSKTASVAWRSLIHTAGRRSIQRSSPSPAAPWLLA